MGRSFHGAVRLAILFSSLLEVLGRFVVIYLVCGGRVSTARRAGWLPECPRSLARDGGLTDQAPGGTPEAAPRSGGRDGLCKRDI